MKLGIYDSGKEEEEKIFLKLVQASEGVLLIAVSSNGTKIDQGDILIINHNGTLKRLTSVSDKFERDSEHRIFMEE